MNEQWRWLVNILNNNKKLLLWVNEPWINWMVKKILLPFAEIKYLEVQLLWIRLGIDVM